MLLTMKERTQPTPPRIFRGSQAASIVFLEITPLVLSTRTTRFALSNVSCKHFLMAKTLRASLLSKPETKIEIEWDADVTSQYEGLCRGHLLEEDRRLMRASFRQSQSTFPIFYLPSDHPTDFDLIPCCAIAYACRSLMNQTAKSNVLVDDSCLVRILPAALAISVDATELRPPRSLPWTERFGRESFLQRLSGEAGNDFLSQEMKDEVIHNNNPATIRQLTIHFSSRLSQPISIGTTSDAFRIRRMKQRRSLHLQNSILSHCAANIISLRAAGDNTITSERTANRARKDPHLLLIHSPNHAEGKTMLAQAVAKRTGCTRTHLIRPGYILAKYGINADAALESMLHSILVSAGATDQKICIILDQLDALLPPRLSGRSSSGDAVEPVLTAIASYLRKVSISLQQSNEVPFPIKNSLYSPKSQGGQILSVRLCLVGIMTCPDDGWKSSISEIEGGHGIFDILVAARYRLPTTAGETKLKAFLHSFESHQVHLDTTARERMTTLAHSLQSARGSTFRRVAVILRDGEKKDDGTVSADSLERAIEKVKVANAASSIKSFEAAVMPSNVIEDVSLFGGVGGAVDAKIALEDALALSPEKRSLLSRFGILPPTGVLLYGPPGCGKTLLAKAVARLLKTSSGGGGSFLSISSSDIVSSEIGTSEKVLLSAFEFADKNSPAVIFFDEFQALFTERDRGGSGKLATTLLQCMDDLKLWSDSGNAKKSSGKTVEEEQPRLGQRVVVLGATNTPWTVDSAFLRPGRFDRVVHVSLPNEDERKSILMVHLGQMRVENRGSRPMLEHLAALIASRTVGFSGADLSALCRAAAILALFDESSVEVVTEAHFRRALEEAKPSSDEHLIQQLQRWKP